MGSVTETDGFELPMIDIGKSLGKFASNVKCGIDVVLDYGDYKQDFDNGEFDFNLAYARCEESIITLSGDDYSKKLQREQTTQFIDIAAFYGLFAAQGKVMITSGATTNQKTGTAIYTDVLTNFINKNNWYIYIQSDRGRSYNFYNNYCITPDNPESLQAGTTDTALEEIEYGYNGWPVIINKLTKADADTISNYYVQLVTDNNTNVALYAQVGTITNAQHNNFCDADYLRLPPDADGNYGNITTMLILNSLAVSDGGKQNIATLSLLLYQGAAYSYDAGTALNDDGSTITINGQPNFFDDVFHLIKAKPLMQSTTSGGLSAVASQKLSLVNYYFNKKQQGITAVQTLTITDAIDTGDDNDPTVNRVTYVTETVDISNSPASVVGSITSASTASNSASNAVTNNNTYALPAPYYYQVQHFTDGSLTINGLLLGTTNGTLPAKILLGITKDENEALKNLVDATTKNPRIFLIDLFDDDNMLVSSENINYQKYKIGLVAEKDATLQLLLPATDIIAYSLDRNYHFTKGYSDKVTTEESFLVEIESNY